MGSAWMRRALPRSRGLDAMNEIERIELVMTKGEHTDGDLAFAVEQWKAALLKLQACSEERDRYKHLAETGTTYVDAIAMRDERDKLACRLDAREKELEELARHADHLNSRIVALDDELLDSTAAAERYALRLQAAEKLLSDTRNDLRQQWAFPFNVAQIETYFADKADAVEKGDFKFYNSVCGICGRTEPHSHNIPSE